MANVFLTKKITTRISASLLIIFILGGLTLIGSQILDLPRFLSLFAFYSSYLIGGALGIYASRKIGLYTHIGKSLLFIGLALIVNALGVLVWDFYDFALNKTAPYPSLADFIFVLFVPLMIMGLWSLLKIYKRNVDKKTIIECSVVFVVIISIIYLFVGIPNISISNKTLETSFNIFYTFSNIIMLAMAYLILRVSSEKMFDGAFYIAIGLMFTAIGDIVYSLRIANSEYFYGDVSDFFFIISGIIITVGIYIMGKNFIEGGEQIR